jgi:hypothetical protein
MKKYYAYHTPSGEEWVVLGINRQKNEICVAGWPPTIAKLSDCVLEDSGKLLSEEEITYRDSEFGSDWDYE